MGFTRIGNLTGCDTGTGGPVNNRPNFWHEDVAVLVNQPDTDQLLEINIIFINKDTGLQAEMKGLVGKADACLDTNAIVVLACPPYLQKGEVNAAGEYI